MQHSERRAAKTTSTACLRLRIFELIAPTGCLQYYTGVSGRVKSFNYDGGNRHLNRQRYSICVRTEVGFCGITWEQVTVDPQTVLSTPNFGNPGLQSGTTVIPNSFQISATFSSGTSQGPQVGSDVTPEGSGTGRGLCSGAKGQTDFISIPCGSKDGKPFSMDPLNPTSTLAFPCADKFCGTLFGYASGTFSPQSVTSRVQPFILGVNFDEREEVMVEATGTTPAVFEPGIGFHLQYYQVSCLN
ncbi:unnamed protein product [Darwinula stevensoni]|uniref:CUB domain-containing protein n=1 Tax=Darwinula stevensoni TaxID=69355 RepID=A0A7R8X526_9CRUS|nr:unnamed protein product [Darwinula stevensoni]CAG0884200.1 unnamed protein product [Darwinula stevensoni]